ncbi:Na+/proline symporter [Desulfosporosinus orientis DSM 765]|uniref:Na+/proline symporter n=1 Tax=Desulfosporosinus orientis (strain ATCC 19365 / DSM 765 / NCIMB 8382 / VKM B-1628 / Singapore I) TaxID=768706 RepID=G7WAM6_DESOD|nr:sodium:solute symporter family protein [Desulfosporosinus orientis]AET66794.1 Na+/proline symporter [Desulfosporosinus orientis DSM 765]
MAKFDIVIIFLYFGAMIAIGIFANRKQKNMEDYYVGGRKASALSIMSLWLCSWIGGAAIVGGAGKAYEIGVSSVWMVLTTAIGCVIFALTFASLLKKMGDYRLHLTYPDLIEDRYDNRARLIATITTLLAYIAYTAGQLAAAGTIIHTLMGWSLGTSFVIAAFVVIMYTATGGFIAVTYTDWIQFSLLLLGIAVLGVPIAWGAVGGISGLQNQLPTSYFDIGAWGWRTILGLMVSMVFSFFTAMDSYTRMFSAKDVKSARNGTLLAALGVVIIAFSATFLGMSAKVLYPDLTGGGGVAIATLVIQLFPIGLKGLIIVGILAAIMSTADICLLTASANFTRDIYQRYINPAASDKHMLRLGMISSLAIGILSAFMAWKMMNIINILYVAFTINSAGLFIPTIAIFYWKKANANAAFWSMTLSLITVLIWYVGGSFSWGSIFSLDPVWPGLAVSILVFVSLSHLYNSTEIGIQKMEIYNDKTYRK